MPLHKKSLVDISIERIKNNIVENDLRPGDKFLSEKELIEQLQVSRTVIREALISLQTIGILTIKRGGIYINSQNLTVFKEILQHHYDTHGVRLKELIEIRQIIELGALRLIIEKNIEVDIKKLRNINQTYHQTIVNQQDTREADQLFHQELMKATGNEIYFNFSEIITDYFSITKINLIQSQVALLSSYNEHEDLIDKIQAQDLPKAHSIMIKHLQPIVNYINDLEAGINETNTIS